MEKIDFKDIYIESVLKDIRNTVNEKVNIFSRAAKQLSGDNITRADNIMREVLKDVLLHSSNPNQKIEEASNDLRDNFFILQLGDEEQARIKLRCCLILYYTAIYFGSVDLLYGLFRRGVDFGSTPEKLSLCFLDSELVTYFKNQEQYLDLALKKREAFEGFYESIKEVDGRERQKYLKMFSSLVSSRDDIPATALRKSKFDVYDEETYMKASTEQLNNIIDQFGNFKEEANIARINRLIKETDYCYGYGVASDFVFNMFSDEELQTIDGTLGRYLTDAKDYNPDVDIERLRYLYSMRPGIVDYRVTYNPHFLEIFSDEEIVRMDKDTLIDLYYNRDKYFPDDFTIKNRLVVRRNVLRKK